MEQPPFTGQQAGFPPQAPAGAHGWPSAHRPPYQSTGPQPADFGARLGAYAIDAVFATLLSLAVYLVLGVGGAVAAVALLPDTPWPAVVMVLLSAAAGVASMFCYLWLPTARSGQTPGKRFLGIRVVDTAGGLPPSRAAAAKRAAVFLLLNLVPLGWIINLVITLTDEPRQRSIHDRAAGTAVVRA